MKVLIIEDEHLAAARLREMLLKYDSNIGIEGVVESVKSAILWFEQHDNPDLVFMDIQLADGLSFDIFEKAKIVCPVIFTTAYEEYAIKAFKVNSIDYLLKPIDQEELKASMTKFLNLSLSETVPRAIDPKILDTVRDLITHRYKSRFSIKLGEHIKTVTVESILFFFSFEKGTFIQADDNKRYLINDTLDQVMEAVDPHKFFRLNRKYLVSFRSISDIITYSNSRLKISLKNSDDTQILVSRERVAEFRAWLDS
ncbi:MAG TPA: LytTR family DNA-binding domain-containing protein [Cyclobacteriaceae bacterium]|nr:LytTR family DNA-binding domain-containing protein [Cyclobacteriaceae bacterium]